MLILEYMRKYCFLEKVSVSPRHVQLSVSLWNTQLIFNIRLSQWETSTGEYFIELIFQTRLKFLIPIKVLYSFV